MRGKLHEFVLPASIVYTDEYSAYDSLDVRERYVHRRIPHHARIWVDGTTHTQTIEGFFGNFRSGLRALTTPSRTSGFRATSTNGRGATTAASPRLRCSAN